MGAKATAKFAFYFVSGDEVEVWTGDHLEKKEVAHAGDYIFIPAGVPHVAVNRSATLALLVGAGPTPISRKALSCGQS